MRVLITGGRHFANRQLLFDRLSELDAARPFTVLMHGNATGADALADKWAAIVGVPVERYPADWNLYGRAAGPIRNREMMDLRPDLVVAFPGGRGTANMVAIAKAEGCEVIEVQEAT